MEYAELKEGVKYFERKWPPDRDSEYKYSALRARGPDYWLHLDRMDEERLWGEIIDGFLQKWGCRIAMTTPEQIHGTLHTLKQAVDDLREYYSAVGRFRIEDIDFQGLTLVRGKQESIRSVVNYIYSRFLQVKGLGPTCGSKLMHMALPDLFVMLDAGIIQRYCVPKEKHLPGLNKPKKSYVAFLILMQENICHAIESCPGASATEKLEVIQQMQSEHNGIPLPRLLDMANFAVRDCEQTICLSCMNKAKARWAKLAFVPDYDSGE